MSARTTRLGYVRELDGLRALAVVWVMFGHLHLRGFQNGGVLGVDAFFVLSGFLITNLLVEEFGDTGRVNVAHFYARRGLRLWPALYAMLAVALFWAFVVLDGDERHRLLVEIAAAGTYTYDIVERIGTNAVRGEASSRFNFMLYHTWSLALEEQFYLVWPPLLVVALRRRALRTALAVVAAIVVLVSLSRFAGHFGPLTVFERRPDSLLVGCFAALAWRPGSALRNLDLRAAWWRVVPPLATAAIVAAAAVVPRSRFSPLYLRWVSPFYAVAIAGLIVVVVHATPSWARALTLRPLVEVGKRSYGLYLWHLPVFIAVGASAIHGQPTVVQLAVKLVLAFAAAWVSYLVVERPALRLKARFARPVDVAPQPSS